MKTYRLAILGFGNVGRALARHLQAKTEILRTQYGVEWVLTGVATRQMGWLADPDGLDVSFLLQGQIPAEKKIASADVATWLKATQADVLFELTSTNPQTGQPAIEHVRAALQQGKHVVTANKGTVVHAYHEFSKLAQAQGKRFLFEGTVMAGAPVFSLFRSSLPVAQLQRIRALFNSTCNVVIAEMEQGKSFEQAVKKAQELGIAETDPSNDIDGWDAAVKACILANVLMNEPVSLAQIEREGIRNLTPEMVQQAHVAGKRYKLVSTVERAANGQIQARVQPEMLAANDPLSSVGPAGLLTHFEMDMVPGLTLTLDVPMTETAGPDVTAYDVLADFIRAVQSETSSR
jgi:homoserine dehydrogenase